MTDLEFSDVQEVLRGLVVQAVSTEVNRVLKWVIGTTLFLVVAGILAGAKIMSNQEAMQRTMGEWRTTAPAPAESTRVALQNLSKQVAELSDDLRNLRRDLGKPR